MFENFKKLNTGRTRVKVIGALLAMILTFSNFTLLGSYIGKTSYAIDTELSNQNDTTNSNNVKFEVYLDAGNKEIKERFADINSEDVKLYISVNVKNSGYLRNAKVKLDSTNFKIKGREEITEFPLDTIQTDKGITVEIPVLAISNETYNLGLLNMISSIKLTGEYIDNKGNVTDIEAVKRVKIAWETENISEENLLLSQEVITNKTYTINGEEKRVIQVLVKSSVKENSMPVKQTNIEMNIPEIGVLPEEVKVSSYSTKATNGKASIEFADLETSSWEYNKETGKINIEILNQINDEGNISWAKNAQDEIIVTYIYNEDAAFIPFISNAKTVVEIYGADGGMTTVEKSDTLVLQEMPEVGNIVNITNNIASPIYKGNLYINEEEKCTETYNIYVSYKELVNKIQIVNDEDKIENVLVNYKETKINRQEAINVLGETGTISIYDVAGNKLLQTINLSEQRDGDYIVVTYPKEISRILIETSVAQKEGKIEIINQKVIKAINTDSISEISKLVTGVNLIVSDTDNKVVAGITSYGSANILEPNTKYSISLDKTNLSTGVQNDLKITAELKAENSSDKLFINPEIRIELPAEVSNAVIENITPVLHSEELTLKSYEIVTNKNGNKEVVIKIEGTQTSYGQNACLVIGLKLRTNSFMASTASSLKSICVNGQESVETSSKISFASKAGFVTKNTLAIGENVVEKINTNNIEQIITENANATIISRIINNFGETLSNINIIGKVPKEITIIDNVVTNIEGALIYYSEEENPEVNSQSWISRASDLSKVRAFKIVVPEDVEQGDLIEVGYKSVANIENLSVNTEMANKLNINYVVNGQAKQEKMEFVIGALVEDNSVSLMSMEQEDSETEKTETKTTVAGESVEIEVSPKAMTETLYQGQIVTYEIKVKNNGTEDLENPKLTYKVPEGAVITELTYAQGTEMTYTDKTDIANRTITLEGKFGVGEERTAEITLKIKEDATQIANNIVVKNADDKIIGTLITSPVKVISGDLNVMLSREDNMNAILTEGSTMGFIVIVKNNTTLAMKNLKITSKIPEGTVWLEDVSVNKKWTYNKQTKEISYTLDSLEAGETFDVRFRTKIDTINNKTCEELIDNMALVKTESNVEYSSSVYTNVANKAYWKINMKSGHSETLKEGDSVKYIINVTNTGKRGGIFTLLDEIPEEINIQKMTYYRENEKENKKIKTLDDNKVELKQYLEVGETVVIELEGKVKDLDGNVTSKKVTNLAKISLGNNKYIESNAITNTIIKDPNNSGGNNQGGNNPGGNNPGGNNQGENNQGGSNQGGNSQGGNNSGEENTGYSISGTVWLDENKDGIKTSDEKVLQSQKVMLLNTEGKLLKETLTSLTGTYKFTNLSKGKYLVALEYDTDKYAVTKYQVGEAEENTDSDIIAKETAVDGKSILVGITDTITMGSKNISNIDMGLIENPVFDLSLNKYISKVVVTTSKDVSTYDYEKPTNLAKVEINKKEISGASLLVEYEIEVVNEGDVEGYVTDIIDHLPKELTFNSEMNTEWYLGADNYLHYMALEPQAIAPGKSQKVKLVLTKNLKNDSTGTIKNIAEIGENTNLNGMVEIDSIAGNHKEGEDDISFAELIISIKTGSPVLYIGIVFVSMLVLGIGIYIINKKVLKVRF